MKKVYKNLSALKIFRLFYYKLPYKIFSLIHVLFHSISFIINNIKIRIDTKNYLHELDIEDTDDIYISTYSKSGTTWLQMILYQLTSKGEMNFKHIYEVIPWIDECMPKKIDVKTKPRIFKTHLDYNNFPAKFEGKIICVVRNGMDVAASQFHHYKDWGSPEVTFSEIFKNIFAVAWFKHTKRWIENKNKHKVLYIRYEDLKMNLEKEIYRVADFCNIKYKKTEIPRILERSSFDFMKKHEDKFGMEVYKFNPNNFIRKGKVNLGKTYFSDEELNIYKTKFNKYLSEFELLNNYNSEKLIN